jgi:O-glycosyl hydrolase
MNKIKEFKTPAALSLTLVIVLALFAACDMGYEHNKKVYFDAEAPFIIGQPQSKGVMVDDEVELAVTAALPVNAKGTLQYQWYRYLTYRAFQDQAGITIPGATDSTYTPPTDTDGEYNYYVVVTNNFKEANGRKTASVKSNAATITVNDPRNARFPVITAHPAGASLNWSPRMTLPELAVEVEEFAPAISDTIRYQWYVSRTLSNTQGLLIEGATSPTLVPPVALPGQEADDGVISGAGEYYYFCVVTNFFFNAPGKRESSVASNPALISISVNPDASEPVIRAQPQNAIYFPGDTVTALSVTVAEPEDGGTLSYQWYTSLTSSTSGGTPISGATTDSFMPPVNPSALGVYYYYVVVTNTNTYVTNPTKTVTSRVAEVNVTNPANMNANAIFRVVYGGMNNYQYVRGFGGMDVAWGNFPSYAEEDYENMYNPEKFGYNILRIMILPTYVDINRTLKELVANEIYTTQKRHRFYENVKLVNRYGGYVLASPWSPPAAWKTNNSINGGGDLRASDYQNYANYLRAFAQNMLNNGAPIYAISIQNEPNYPAGYDGCEWTSVQMRDFFIKVGRFTEGVAGYGGGKVIDSVKTMNGESANNVNVHEGIMANATARPVVDILARHNYGNRETNGVTTFNWIYRATDAKEMWMTEHNLNSNSGTSYPNDHTWNYMWYFMNDVDMTIRRNHEAAFVWWSSKRFYSFLGDNTYKSATIGNEVDSPGELLPRGWGLAHYAKFAKESYRVNVEVSGRTYSGAQLVEGTNVNGDTTANFESTTVKVSAFMKLKDGEVFPVNWRNQDVPIEDITEITMVMFTPTDTSGGGGVDMGTVRLQLPEGFRISSATALRSDPIIFNRSSTNRGTPREETVAITADRNAAFVSLPVSTILSVRFTQ